MTRRRPFVLAALFLSACGQAVPPVQPETPKAEKSVEAVAPPKTQTPRQAETPPKTQAPPTAEAPPVAGAPRPPTPAAAPRKPAPAPPTSPAQAAASKPVPAPPVAASPPPVAAPAPLDLKSLETRIKATDAIGVLTKLSLKNQVDDLIGRFLAFHDGKRPPTLSELRPAYELLLMKFLSLLQDKDAPLAQDINASREAIWSLLTDRQKLAVYK